MFKRSSPAKSLTLVYGTDGKITVPGGQNGILFCTNGNAFTRLAKAFLILNYYYL